ncbi:HAD family hydrolase [Micromonospora okii]|uniref:HAD family hydrolase n=1 Tax=Micromonospora okii TaxID=1182970 RepID=UPI001E3B3B85|nr:HAD family hydrolase [Micromonospora okii]
MRKRDGQTLIFDADDTLWENNVLFENVIESFIEWLAHPTLDRAQVRAILDEIEAANAVTHGYGSAMFLRSLHDCFERLRERPGTPQEQREIEGLARALLDREVELIPGVAETLAELQTRHHLLLFTKGHAEEQRHKYEASGLQRFFAAVHIVEEKRTADYLRLIAENDLDPGNTWMIGNSPKSDIVPARQAGMNAVFIPNDNTWVLEHEVLDPTDGKVLSLARFPDLLQHF